MKLQGTVSFIIDNTKTLEEIAAMKNMLISKGYLNVRVLPYAAMESATTFLLRGDIEVTDVVDNPLLVNSKKKI